MMRWTGLAPWEFEFLFPGSLASTFLEGSPMCVVNFVAQKAINQYSAAQVRRMRRYMGTSPINNCAPLGPFVTVQGHRVISRASLARNRSNFSILLPGNAFVERGVSYERGTPVVMVEDNPWILRATVGPNHHYPRAFRVRFRLSTQRATGVPHS